MKKKKLQAKEDAKKNNTNSKEQDNFKETEPIQKLLKEEKMEIINSLNCTNENNFFIHVFKDYDINHLFISIPKFDEFNSTKINDWLTNAVELSVKTLTEDSVRFIYESQKPALIYIEKSFSRKKSYLNNEIKDDYSSPENDVFKILYSQSFMNRKKFLYLKANENDYSSQLIMDLFNLKQIKSPLIVGLKYNKINSRFGRKILTRPNNLEDTKALVQKYINENINENINNEEENQYENLIENEDEHIKNPFYLSESDENLKYEIYLFNENNYDREINQRDDKTIILLFTYRRILKDEVNYNSFD